MLRGRCCNGSGTWRRAVRRHEKLFPGHLVFGRRNVGGRGRHVVIAPVSGSAGRLGGTRRRSRIMSGTSSIHLLIDETRNLDRAS